jgi:hypothetical protein
MSDKEYLDRLVKYGKKILAGFGRKEWVAFL